MWENRTSAYGRERVGWLIDTACRGFVSFIHTCSVPVTFDDGLGVESAVDLEVFADTHKNVTGHHQLIAGIDSDTGPNLVFLLTRHNLSVHTGNSNSCVQTCLVHGIGDGASKVVFRTDTAVIRSLRTGRHTTLWPTKWRTFIQVEESEFLFQSKPWSHVIGSLEGFGGCYCVIIR